MRCDWRLRCIRILAMCLSMIMLAVSMLPAFAEDIDAQVSEPVTDAVETVPPDVSEDAGNGNVVQDDVVPDAPAEDVVPDPGEGGTGESEVSDPDVVDPGAGEPDDAVVDIPIEDRYPIPESIVYEWSLAAGDEAARAAFDANYRIQTSYAASSANTEADHGVAHAVDGDIDTFWAADPYSESAAFIELGFADVETIGSVIFSPHLFPTEGTRIPFEVQISRTESGSDDFELAAWGRYDSAYSWPEIRLDGFAARRVRLVFPHVEGMIPTCREIYVARAFAREEADKEEEEAPIAELTDVHPVAVSIASVKTWPMWKMSDDVKWDYDLEMRAWPWGSPKTNMGWYGQNTLDKVIDGSEELFWETGRTNTDAEKTWLEFEFPKGTEIGRIVYGCRLDAGGKGFPTKFEIYGSQTESGEDFELVAIGSCGFTFDMIEISFQQQPFTRLRFLFRESTENYPSCREMMFYRTDSMDVIVENLFTDYKRYEILEEYRSIEALEELRAQVIDSPKYETYYKQLIDRAISIVDGTLVYNPRLELFTDPSQDNVVERVGNVVNYARNTLKFNSFSTNRQAVGISAHTGDTITVYVDADENDPLPKIRFSQAYGYWSSWLSGEYQLGRGVNTFTVPNFKISGANYSTYDIASGGAIYVVNPYTPSQQSTNVKMYFEGCDTYPVYRKGGSESAYKRELREYADRVHADPSHVIDFTELVGDHVMMTVRATQADAIYDTKSPKVNLVKWDEILHETLKFLGVKFNPSEQYYSPLNERLNVNYRVSQVWSGGYMFAYTEHIGLYANNDGENTLIYCVDDATGNTTIGWGLVHEMGHTTDTPGRIIGETTNNMPACFVSSYYNHTQRNMSNIADINTLASERNLPKDSLFNRDRYNYMIFWMVESLYQGYWGDTDNIYRFEDHGQYNGLMNNTERHVYYQSLASGIDLGYWFERVGYNNTTSDPVFTVAGASQTYRNLIQQAISSGKIRSEKVPFWYLDWDEYNWVHDNADVRTGKGRLYFGTEKPEIVRVLRTSDGYSIILPAVSNAAHLGYEIWEGTGSSRQIIGFTHDASFTDTATYPDGYVPVYTVVAYDRLLKKSAMSDEASIFVDTGVAELNGTVYDTVSAAVAMARTGDTIYILKDIVDSGIVINNKSIIITPKDSDVVIRKGGNAPVFTVSGSSVLVLQKNGTHELTLDGGSMRQGSPLVRLENSATFTMTDGTLQNSYSTGQGGAISVTSASCKVNLTRVKLMNNRATDGGAIYNVGTAMLDSCLLENNVATGNGGAICNNNGGVMRLPNSVLQGNSAVNGGAYWANGFTEMFGTTICDNSATNGGAIWFASANGARTLKVDQQASVYGNRAEKGSILYSSNGIATFGNVTIGKDTADPYDMCVAGGTVTLDGRYVANAMNIFKNGGRFVVSNRMPADATFTVEMAQYTTAEAVLESDFDISDADMAKVRLADGRFKLRRGENLRSIYIASDSKVILHANEGVINSGNVTSYVEGQYMPLPTNVTREGYQFAGWFDNEKLEGASVKSISETDTGDKEFWAKWTTKRYSITYNANGGSIPGYPVRFYDVTESVLLPTGLTRNVASDVVTSGERVYRFEGWYDNAAFNGSPITEIPVGTMGNLTFYAKWSHLAGPIVQEHIVPATCIAGGTVEEVTYCVDCGIEMSRTKVTTSEPLAHDFGDWVVTDTPDCGSGSVRTRTCKNCGYVETDGAAATHDWEGDYTIDQEPTCTAAGSKSIHCKSCNATKDPTTIPAKGHVVSADNHENEIAATCISDGSYDSVTRCRICGAVLSSTHVVVPALGHSYGPWEEISVSSCSAEGARKHSCTVCGYTETESTGYASHTWEREPRVDIAPTCTTDGSQSVHCSKCGATKLPEVIPATGHVEGQTVIENQIPADCVNPGSHTEAVICAICHATIRKINVTDAALGHRFGDWFTIVSPDCSDTGARQRKCEVCGYIESENIAASGHKWDSAFTIDAEPTCTAAGSKSIHCLNCGAVRDVTVIPAKGHVPGGIVIENEITPNCVRGGSHTETIYCTVCNAVIDRKNITTDPIGHTFGAWKVVHSPSCEDAGTEQRSCHVCGFTETRGLSELGHDWAAGFTVDREPTCTDEGSKSIHCKNCNATKDPVTIPAKGHTAKAPVRENEKPATCVTGGYVELVTYCADCGAVILRDVQTSAANGHTFGPWEDLVNVSCYESGARKHTCTACGFVEIESEGVANHTWEAEYTIDVDATCVTDGSMSIHCRNCDAVTKVKVIPATGHTESEPVRESEVAASCTTGGSYTEAVYCGKCHALMRQTRVNTDALGHAFGEWTVVVAPDCDDEGLRQRVCGVCGYVESENLAVSGHAWEPFPRVDVEPTCVSDGSQSVHCANCGAVTDVEVIPMTGHAEGEHVVENELAPNCTTDGFYYDVVLCSVCGAEIRREQVIVKATGHVFGDWEIVQTPDCDDAGLQKHVCTLCGYAEMENLEESGHDWMDGYTVDREPTCVDEGSQSIHCRNCDAVKDVRTSAPKGHIAGEVTRENETAASCTESGSYLSVTHCAVCDEIMASELHEIPATGHSFKDGVCSVCGAEDPDWKPGQETAKPTATPTVTPKATKTPNPTATPTAKPSSGSTKTPSPTAMPTPNPTDSTGGTATSTPTAEPTPTPSPTPAPIEDADDAIDIDEDGAASAIEEYVPTYFVLICWLMKLPGVVGWAVNGAFTLIWYIITFVM